MSVATVPLGELCEILSGFAWSASKFNQDKRGVPIIRIQNVDAVLSNDFVYWDEPYDERFVIRQGDLLLTLSGSFRIESWSGPNALLNQRIIKLTPSPKLDRGWLLRVLRPRLGQIERLGKHALVNNVSLGDIRNLAIPLPPLAEQRRIAEVLDRAEALRAKRRAALAQLDSLTQSLFLDLFGDPVTNPKNWPTVRFEEICDRVTVGIVVKPASYYVSEGVPALRSLNIKPGKIVLQDLVYFSKSDNETKLTKTKLKTGDLVLVRSGQPGTAAVVPRELDGVNAIDLLIATPLPKLVDVTFLCEFFNSAGGRDLVLSRQRGQVQKHLNVGSLNEAVIPLPPITLQREFAQRVTAVEALKTAQRASLAELDALFATLQHRAFKGEL